jgi:hypothetical protein
MTDPHGFRIDFRPERQVSMAVPRRAAADDRNEIPAIRDSRQFVRL